MTGVSINVQICRCLPFIHRIHNMDEVLSLRDLRAIVKEQFAQYKEVKDPRVSDSPLLQCLGQGYLHSSVRIAVITMDPYFIISNLKHQTSNSSNSSWVPVRFCHCQCRNVCRDT